MLSPWRPVATCSQPHRTSHTSGKFGAESHKHTAQVSSPSLSMRVLSDTAGCQHTECCACSHLDTHRPSQASVLEEIPRGTRTSSRLYITSLEGKRGTVVRWVTLKTLLLILCLENRKGFCWRIGQREASSSGDWWVPTRKRGPLDPDRKPTFLSLPGPSPAPLTHSN